MKEQSLAVADQDAAPAAAGMLAINITQRILH